MVRPLLLQQVSGGELVAEARQVCTVEAELGDSDSMYHLALLDLGLAEWAPSQAVPRIESAAEKGVSEAQYWLAWQYEAGPLLPNDVELARKWYERAGENEHPLALWRLADAHERGELGLGQNKTLARRYRARAQQCARQSG